MQRLLEIAATGAAVVFAVGLFGLIVLYSSQRSSPPNQPETLQTEPKKDSESFWQRTTEDPVAFFTLWLVIFTAVLSAVAVLQIRFLLKSENIAERSADAAFKSAEAANKSAQVAEQQAKIAEATLVANQRPWVSFTTVQPSEDLTYDVNGARITMVYRLENSGHSPAQRVWVNVFTFMLRPNGPNPLAAQEAELSAIRNRRQNPQRFGHVLFPSQTIDQVVTTYVAKAEIDEMVEAKATNFFPMIIATIEYEFSFAPGKHLTSHIFELRQQPNRFGPPINQVITRQDLMVSQFFAGAYAD
jgi:hypothetical protein